MIEKKKDLICILEYMVFCMEQKMVFGQNPAFSAAKQQSLCGINKVTTPHTSTSRNANSPL